MSILSSFSTGGSNGNQNIQLQHNPGTTGNSRSCIILAAHQNSSNLPSITFAGVAPTFLGRVDKTEGGLSGTLSAFYLLENQLPTGGSYYPLAVSGGGVGKTVGIYTFEEVSQTLVPNLTTTSSSNEVTSVNTPVVVQEDLSCLVDIVSLLNAKSGIDGADQTSTYGGRQQSIWNGISHKAVNAGPSNMSWFVTPKANGYLHLIAEVYDLSVDLEFNANGTFTLNRSFKHI